MAGYPVFSRAIRKAAQPYAKAGDEPSLRDLFADPVFHAVLARDGLTLADVRVSLPSAYRSAHRLQNVDAVLLV